MGKKRQETLLFFHMQKGYTAYNSDIRLAKANALLRLICSLHILVRLIMCK
jgi:hypothetical protein